MPDAVAVTAGQEVLGRPLRLVRRLGGGQHAQTVLAEDGHERVVVRTFPRGDDAVAREADVLALLGPLGSLVPTLLAHGEVDGVPVIVTTALDGTTPSATLDPDVVAVQMADLLARIHRIVPEGLPDDGRAPLRRAGRLAGLANDLWASIDPGRVLTHGDFWSGNAVWTGDRLTGVVDWSGGTSAPRGVDVAWCRQDLVLLGAPAAADRFADRYREQSGAPLDDLYAWDVIAAARADPYVETWAPNSVGIGRAEITARVIRQRFDAWARRLMAD